MIKGKTQIHTHEHTHTQSRVAYIIPTTLPSFFKDTAAAYSLSRMFVYAEEQSVSSQHLK